VRKMASTWSAMESSLALVSNSGIPLGQQACEGMRIKIKIDFVIWYQLCTSKEHRKIVCTSPRPIYEIIYFRKQMDSSNVVYDFFKLSSLIKN
jgi:hypothetical protein